MDIIKALQPYTIYIVHCTEIIVHYYDKWNIRNIVIKSLTKNIFNDILHKAYSTDDI